MAIWIENDHDDQARQASGTTSADKLGMLCDRLDRLESVNVAQGRRIAALERTTPATGRTFLIRVNDWRQPGDPDYIDAEAVKAAMRPGDRLETIEYLEQWRDDAGRNAVTDDDVVIRVSGGCHDSDQDGAQVPEVVGDA